MHHMFINDAATEDSYDSISVKESYKVKESLCETIMRISSRIL